MALFVTMMILCSWYFTNMLFEWIGTRLTYKESLKSSINLEKGLVASGCFTFINRLILSSFWSSDFVDRLYWLHHRVLMGKMILYTMKASAFVWLLSMPQNTIAMDAVIWQLTPSTVETCCPSPSLASERTMQSNIVAINSNNKCLCALLIEKCLQNESTLVGYSSWEG